MSSWRDKILAQFTPKVSRLTLVADPDGLLLEEGILEGIRDRGFELIPFEDHVAFRYAYESKFRSRWDLGKETDLVVVLRSSAGVLDALPFDLLQAGRRLSFNLGDLFPGLSYPVISALDRADLDALYTAQEMCEPGTLGDNAGKEFVLRHVFGIAPELINQPSDLLRMLLQRHYREQRIPSFLDERLIQVLRQYPLFNDWPLEQIVPDREVFFDFLQERWPIFLDRSAKTDNSGVEEKAYYGLRYAGPTDLPFDHHDVRIYIDNLFLEGHLEAVHYSHTKDLENSWVKIGIKTDQREDTAQRVKGLIGNLSSSIPAGDARHGEWMHFARSWAELKQLMYGPDPSVAHDMLDTYQEVRHIVDNAFLQWLENRYAGLINLPPSPPVMLHHVPRYLAHIVRENRAAKVVLLVIDGLSFDQWVTIREVISEQASPVRFRERGIFAWIPTVTSVSRQAVFAGKPPIYFPNSIHTTDKEPALWRQFWLDQDLNNNQIMYAKGLGNGDQESVREMLSHPLLRVVGLVIDKVDKIMHGMELGSAGMHNQVHQWAQKSYLIDLLHDLMDRGYQVFLTSDHGNIEAHGCGRPAEGVIAEMRGERVRVYSDDLLRRGIKERFEHSIAWPHVGLPNDYFPLIAPGRKAFIPEGKCSVTHGGFSLEEVIVPFVQVERHDA